MFNIQHTKAIKVIREWLDKISYSTLNFRIMQFLDQAGQLYPDFNKFMRNIDKINPLYAFIISVFRLGQPAERIYLDTFLSTKVIEALIETGLLLQKEKYYQMPGVGIVTIRGMYFVTYLPETYPTSLRSNQYKSVDLSVQFIMDEIVSQPVGTDFLEVYSDYGILANMAAEKGYKNIYIQPKYPDYAQFIQLNLALNHHESNVSYDICHNKYDLIVSIHLSVKEKIAGRNQKNTNEKDIIQLIPIFCQLKETGSAMSGKVLLCHSETNQLVIKLQ
jgi:hypothetical protein